MERRFHSYFACLAAGICLWAAPVLAGNQSTLAAISGVVKDSTGAIIPGAGIRLMSAASAVDWTSSSDVDGRFTFTALQPGTYRITIEATGFATWTSASVAIHRDESYEMLPIVLQVAPASNVVDVALSRHDIAEEQLRTEEKQRLNGLLPNFKVSYIPNAVPLTAGQKFQLAWATSVDPTTFLFAGAMAGYEQERNNIRRYGQGTSGYAKRYGANYADAIGSEMIGTAVLPSLFHQDPRYFYKGKGSVLSRALYAIAGTFVCKGDNGRWQPNYSGMVSSFAAGGISNLYYPSNSRGARLVIRNALLDYGVKSAGNLLQEFFNREITPSAPKSMAAGARLVLREGAPVSLMLTEDLDFRSAENGQSVAFALADDIRVNGAIVARRGCNAFGEVAYVGPDNEGKVAGLGIRIKYLQVADDRVVLRASKLQVGGTAVSFHHSRVAGGPGAALSGTEIPAGTAVTVYVAGDVSLHAAP